MAYTLQGHRNNNADKVSLLVSKILIWDEKPDKAGQIDINPDETSKAVYVLRECESIEVSDSYKKLINTAKVRFPRGTILKKTIVKEGTEEEVATSSVTSYRASDGTIFENLNQDSENALTPKTFKCGMRIRIYIGYYDYTTTSYGYLTTAAKAHDTLKDREDKAFKNRPPIFDGYIVKVSASSPVELVCENLASKLKTISCRKIKTPKNTTVADLLKDGGKYDLLKGTGLKLHSDMDASQYTLGSIELDVDNTLADIFDNWTDKKLYTYIKYESDGTPALMIGRTYATDKTDQSVLNDSNSANTNNIQLIEFNYDVASDDLTLMNTDPKFLCVDAIGWYANDKQYKISIRLNPEWDGKDPSKKFQLINETKIGKKAMKLGLTEQSSASSKADLTYYNRVPFISSKYPCTQEQLIKDAKDYFEHYTLTGIEGSITIFGDYGLRTPAKVQLLDDREPEKNGIYLVDSIDTTFGSNGYRQKLTMPYCLYRPKTSSDNEKELSQGTFTPSSTTKAEANKGKLNNNADVIIVGSEIENNTVTLGQGNVYDNGSLTLQS